MGQEWHRLLLFLPRRKEAWERGKALFQEDLDQAKGKEYMDYFSIIDFASMAKPTCLPPAFIPITSRSAIRRSKGIC
jgi:hypothetical protein